MFVRRDVVVFRVNIDAAFKSGCVWRAAGVYGGRARVDGVVEDGRVFARVGHEPEGSALRWDFC